MTTHARSALGILLWCLLAACLLWAPVVRGQDTDADTIDDGINYEELFHHVWLAVAENYVGPAEGVDWFAAQREYLPKVKSAQSHEEAYRHLAEMVALVGDPLTFLVTPEEMQNAPEALDPSNFSGVGMMLVQFPDDSIVVTEVFDRAPASRAGLRKGHRIVAVNGVSTAGKSVTEVVQEIRGPAGSQVQLTVADPRGEERTVTVRRAQIRHVPEVTSRRLAGNIGYLSIPSFERGTEAQVLSHLRRLYRTAGLVIDLRNLERTGDPTAFVRIAGLFTDEPLGGLYTRQGVLVIQPDRTWEGGAGALGVPPPTRLDYWEKPVAFIVDGSVAYSQLALALVTALQESGKAVLVGRGVSASLGVGTGNGALELPGGAMLAVSYSQLFSVAREQIIDSLSVETEVPLDHHYLEAWYRGDDLDIEAARRAVLELLER